MWRARLDREVEVDHHRRILARTRQLAGEELVEGDAEGVEVGADVDAAVHPSGLLGGDVRQGSVKTAQEEESLVLDARAAGELEVDEPEGARRGVVDEVVGVHIAMDEPGGVDVAERPRHRQCDLERLGDGNATVFEELLDRAAADVIEDDGGAVGGLHDLVRADDARRGERGEELALEPIAREGLLDDDAGR
jgi:hypothetical protein